MQTTRDEHHVHLRVVGMTCGGCVQHVRSALLAVPGVRDASVELMGESAEVACDETVRREALVRAVRSAGYDAQPVETSDSPEALERRQRETLRRSRQAVFQAIGLVVPIVAIDHLRHMLWSPTPASQLSARLMQIVLFVMLAVSPAGGPILVGGLRSAMRRVGNMDLLVSMAVLVAFTSSVMGLFTGRDEDFVHLHAGAMILGLVCVGRYLEAAVRGRASSLMLSVARRMPKTALRRRGDSHERVSVEALREGDEVLVPEHTTAPTDGRIVSGGATLDEALLTGEPMPVERGPGDRVLAGTMAVAGSISYRVSEPGSRSRLAQIVERVRRAQVGRTQLQRIADRAAAWFVTGVLLIAAGTMTGWLLLLGGAGMAQAIRATVAVLVVACPCALGLATPVVVRVAGGLAATRGILVREPAMLEAMAAIDTVVWDKTGTLTEGRPAVRCVETRIDLAEDDLLRLAAAVEGYSQHPLAKAIIEEAARRGIQPPAAAEYQSIAGGGATGQVDGKRVIVGSLRLLRTRGVEGLEATEGLRTALHPGNILTAVSIDGRLAGGIILSDRVRSASAEAVRRLHALGIESQLLSGDTESSARKVAEQVGIGEVKASVLPEEKAEHVASLRRDGRRVAMVGDGVNDASALAQADVGVAFAAGADLAVEAAGISLTGSSPTAVVDSVSLARASVHLIRQNLFWAFGYNAVMIPLAATGRLSPEWAAAAMMASSLTVVLNALRLPRMLNWGRAASPTRSQS